MTEFLRNLVLRGTGGGAWADEPGLVAAPATASPAREIPAAAWPATVGVPEADERTRARSPEQDPGPSESSSPTLDGVVISTEADSPDREASLPTARVNAPPSQAVMFEPPAEVRNPLVRPAPVAKEVSPHPVEPTPEPIARARPPEPTGRNLVPVPRPEPVDATRHFRTEPPPSLADRRISGLSSNQSNADSASSQPEMPSRHVPDPSHLVARSAATSQAPPDTPHGPEPTGNATGPPRTVPDAKAMIMARRPGEQSNPALAPRRTDAIVGSPPERLSFPNSLPDPLPNVPLAGTRRTNTANQAPSEPTVNVHIGRVLVRAEPVSCPEATLPPARSHGPGGFDDYAELRNYEFPEH